MALARASYLAGDGEEAYRRARQALDEAKGDADSGIWLPGEHLLEHLHLVAGVDGRVIERMTRRRAYCARHGLHQDEAHAAAVLGLLQAMRGQLDAARAELRGCPAPLPTASPASR